MLKAQYWLHPLRCSVGSTGHHGNGPAGVGQRETRRVSTNDHWSSQGPCCEQSVDLATIFGERLRGVVLAIFHLRRYAKANCYLIPHRSEKWRRLYNKA
jgi:hypothetical protein